MKNLSIILTSSSLILILFITTPSQAQEENKTKKTLGERFSTMAGKLMTQKSEGLSGIELNATLVSGLFDMRTEVSETKFYPPGTIEGDYAVSLTFTRFSGIGMVDLQGEITCDGEPLKPVGMGTFIKVFPTPSSTERRISIKAANGDDAEFIIKPIPEIEILNVNGQFAMPTIDLGEDLIIAFTNPPGSENTTVSVGLLSDFMGARTINYFAEVTPKEDVIKIPKESFSEAAIGAKLGGGQFNKGKNFLVLRRQSYLTGSKLGPEQRKGKLSTVALESAAYASWPVIVKGKQVEEEVLTELSFAGRFGPEKIGFEIHKPNALKGIPFSKASKFGLGTLVVDGTTFSMKTEVTNNVLDLVDYTGWSYTRYTTFKTETTVLQFPQLPAEHWNQLLEKFYTKLSALFQSKYNITFTDVNQITATKDYQFLFPINEVNDNVKVSRGYLQTRRMNPSKIGQSNTALTTVSNGENTLQRIMKEAGVDGLVNVEIHFRIGADKKKQVVLIPTVRLSIRGMDETLNNKYGIYAEGRLSFTDGVPFNEAALRNDPDVLLKILNVDRMIECIDYMISNLKKRETELGFEEIWMRKK